MSAELNSGADRAVLEEEAENVEKRTEEEEGSEGNGDDEAKEMVASADEDEETAEKPANEEKKPEEEDAKSALADSSEQRSEDPKEEAEEAEAEPQDGDVVKPHETPGGRHAKSALGAGEESGKADQEREEEDEDEDSRVGVDFERLGEHIRMALCLCDVACEGAEKVSVNTVGQVLSALEQEVSRILRAAMMLPEHTQIHANTLLMDTQNTQVPRPTSTPTSTEKHHAFHKGTQKRHISSQTVIGVLLKHMKHSTHDSATANQLLNINARLVSPLLVLLVTSCCSAHLQL